ncbi:MAG TPA: ATP-binding protein [Candidatus Thermoplasmatota archaeon]|nr:ATP-binding protein [Candidatus Thermoplasmatota archaeon]
MHRNAIEENRLAAERTVAAVRAAVIAFNSLAYALLLDHANTNEPLAFVVIGVSAAYAVAVLALRPAERWPALGSIYFTAIADSVLITLWIAATGWVESPFYLLWYVSVIAISFRYDHRATVAAAVLYCGAYLTLALVSGGLTTHLTDVVVRIAYILLIAALGALMAQESMRRLTAKSRAEARMRAAESAESGLRFTRAIVDAASEAPTASGSLAATIRRVCEEARWPYAETWIFEPASRTLHAGPAWHANSARFAALRESGLGLTLREGDALAGSAWAAREPVWADDLGAENAYHRKDEARAAGLRVGLAVPVFVEDSIVAVLEFLMEERTPRDERFVELVATAALGLGSVIERKRAEEALRDSEARFRVVTESANDAIVTLDGDGYLLYLNPAAERMFGRSSASARGESIAAFVADMSPGAPFEPLLGRTVELTGTRPDGTAFPLEASFTSWRSGDGTFYTGILRDATDRRKADQDRLTSIERLQEVERLKELDRFKTQFINMAAHELGTPLTPIKLQLHILKGKASTLDEPRRKSLEILDRNVDRLGHLVKDLLDVSRLQASRLALERGPCDLNRLVIEAAESFQPQARDADVDLGLTLSTDVLVDADAKRLTQVLFNLLSNALKFTPPRGRITLETERRGEAAVVRVRDSGAGLDANQIKRLFQPFTQVHDTMRITRGGTGLGLYISRGIIELHGGELSCRSDGPGTGCTFAFTVPLAEPTAEAPPRSVAVTAPPQLRPKDAIARRAKELI